MTRILLLGTALMYVGAFSLSHACTPDSRLVELEMEMVQPRIENLIGRPLFSSEKAHLRKAVERRLTERAAAGVPKSNQQEAGKALKEE